MHICPAAMRKVFARIFCKSRLNFLQSILPWALPPWLVKQLFSCLIYQSRYSNFEHAPFFFLSSIPAHWEQTRLLYATSRTCEVLSAIAETIPLLAVNPWLFHEPSNIIGISVIFSSIGNHSSSYTNFFAFSMAIFMFSVQSSLDNCCQYFVYSEKLCLQTGC